MSIENSFRFNDSERDTLKYGLKSIKYDASGDIDYFIKLKRESTNLLPLWALKLF